MIYSNRKVYEKYIKGNFDNIDLWLASARTPDVGNVCRLWQHSHNGRVGGISRPVDINTFNGSRSDFERWLSPVDSLGEATQ
jgi:GH25 family lysozyme M1 (1,4-beta-N-acetylmuramidase)